VPESIRRWLSVRIQPSKPVSAAEQRAAFRALSLSSSSGEVRESKLGSFLARHAAEYSRRLITIAPLFVTYLIFSFLLGILAKVGLPIVWLLEVIFPAAD